MLSALGQPHTIEHLTDDHLFSVDIALPGERIALEVDGPHHFTANTFRPLGEMYCRWGAGVLQVAGQTHCRWRRADVLQAGGSVGGWTPGLV